MKITKQNEERVKAFIEIMIYCQVSEEATGMIITMLPDEKAAMDKLVNYTRTHPKATEAEIIEQAEKISKGKL